MDNWQQEEDKRETVNPEKMKISEQFMTAMFSPREYRDSLLKLQSKKAEKMLSLVTIRFRILPWDIIWTLR